MPLTTNLEGYWKFDESSGSAADSTANSNTLVPEQLPTTNNLVAYWKLDGDSTDTIGSLDGTDTNVTYSAGNGIIVQGAGFAGQGKIVFADDSILKPTGPFSIQAWFKSSNKTTGNTIFANINSRVSDSVYGGYLCRTSATTGYVNFAIADLTENLLNVNGDTDVCDGSWHHIVFIFTGETYLIYVDGVEDATATDSDAPQYLSPQYPRLGEWQSDRLGPNFQQLNGAIDEIGFWDRALSAAEVFFLYNGGAGLAYSFSDPNSYYIAGKIGNAINLTTGPRYLDIANADITGLNFTGDCSFGFWINLKEQPSGWYPAYQLINKSEESSDLRSWQVGYGWNGADYQLGFNVANDNEGTGVTDLYKATGVTLTPGSWDYVVVAWKADIHTAYFYVNNTLVGTSTGVQGYTSLASTTAPLKVGVYKDPAGAWINGIGYTIGKFDMLGIWSRTLTAGDVSLLYNNGAGRDYPFTGKSSPVPTFYQP